MSEGPSIKNTANPHQALHGSCYLVEERSNPSTDYFVLPAIRHSATRVIRCTWNNLPQPQDLYGATVIFVRYVPASWRRLITLVRPHLAGLIYFMDDDLFDYRSARGLGWRYRYKLAHLATWQQGWLRQMQAQLWVSTPWLEQKYSALQPHLKLPVQLGEHPQPRATLTETTDTRRVFYHGSASHLDEIRWLAPVMQSVLEQDPRVVFEIIGTAEVRKRYRGLPRVQVVAPMKWPAYQDFLMATGRHIGLAPMLGHPFNKARSYTKLFDITRAGAAGIYAEQGPWAHLIEDREHGLLTRMHPEAWAGAILTLAADDALRTRLSQNAHSRIQSECSGMHSGHSV